MAEGIQDYILNIATRVFDHLHESAAYGLGPALSIKLVITPTEVTQAANAREAEEILNSDPLNGSDHARLIVQWLRQEVAARATLDAYGAEIFCRFEERHPDFKYCHFVVIDVQRKPIDYAMIRDAGWHPLGAVSGATPIRVEIFTSQFVKHFLHELYHFGNADWAFPANDGEPIKFAISTPVELFDTSWRCQREIAEAVANEWAPLVSIIGPVHCAHVQLLPHELEPERVTAAA
jgi:hypothetical protein